MLSKCLVLTYFDIGIKMFDKLKYEWPAIQFHFSLNIFFLISIALLSKISIILFDNALLDTNIGNIIDIINDIETFPIEMNWSCPNEDKGVKGLLKIRTSRVSQG